MNKYPDVLAELMASENFDASQALAEDEMSLFAEIRRLMSFPIELQDGQNEYTALLARLKSRPGGTAFREVDIKPRYQLAKYIGQIHIDFLSDFCSALVDFKEITIPHKCLQALCKLNTDCPWAKVALMCDNYLSQPTSVGSHKGIADNWKESDIIDLCKSADAGTVDLVTIESHLVQWLGLYSHDPWSKYKIVSRTGMMLRNKKKLENWPNELSIIESKVREEFPPTTPLPARITTEPKIDGRGDKTVKRKDADAEEIAPALSFNARGEVENDVARKAHEKGLAINVACVATKRWGPITKGRGGVILSFNGSNPRVRFKGDKMTSDHEIEFPVAFLAKEVPPPPKAVETPKPKEETEAKDIHIYQGIEWQGYTTEDLRHALEQWVVSLVSSFSIKAGPTPAQVKVSKDPRMMLAGSDLPPNSLTLVPRPASVTMMQDWKDGDEFDIRIEPVGGKDNFFIDKAAHFRINRAEISLGALEEGKTKRCIDPVIFLEGTYCAARKCLNGYEELDYYTSKGIECCPFWNKTSDTTWKKAASSLCAQRYEVIIRCWTNPQQIEAGKAIVLPWKGIRNPPAVLGGVATGGVEDVDLEQTQGVDPLETERIGHAGIDGVDVELPAGFGLMCGGVDGAGAKDIGTAVEGVDSAKAVVGSDTQISDQASDNDDNEDSQSSGRLSAG